MIPRFTGSAEPGPNKVTSDMTDAVDQKMAELSRRFGRRLIAKINKIEEAWRGGGRMEPRDLYRMVHSLAGSGTTFGYSGVSASALAIEDILLRALESGSVLGAADGSRVDDLLIRLRQAAGTPDDPT